MVANGTCWSARTTTSTSRLPGSASRRASAGFRPSAPTVLSSTATVPAELIVMQTFRWSSASRVFACGRFTGRLLTDIMGAVTSRMMTSTSATSMIGVTFTFVISSGRWTRARMSSAPHHGDAGGAELARLVQHAHERAVRHAVFAAQHDEPRRAQLDQRPERHGERVARDARAVHDHPPVGLHAQLDPVGVL